MTTVPGLDVSYWQAEVDWKRVKASGMRFVFVKATEGVAYTDPTFVQNWGGAGSQDILRGAYCFFHPNQDAREQANRFVRAVRERHDEPELPCSVDLEVTDGVPNQKIIAGVKIWLDEVEQRLGRRAMMYAGVSFLETHFVDRGQPPEWTRDYALWLGWFPKKYTAGMAPLMPHGWATWTFWQYSGEGRVSGIDVPVDLDLFNGTPEQLAAFAKQSAPASVQKTHIVSAGETAESIAEKYSISAAELMAANEQLVRPGERLVIPGQAITPSLPKKVHTVAAGETLSSIAQKYGTSISLLAARNNIANPNFIQVGQVLIVA